MYKRGINIWAGILASAIIISMSGCKDKSGFTIVEQESIEVREELVLYSPTARGNEIRDGGVMNPMQEAIAEFEIAHPEIMIAYKSYTPQDYKEKSYDDVAMDRIRSHMGDDLYILNPDAAYEMAQEGYLVDLSDLDTVQYLTDAALNQCTVDGKVISVPQVIVCYGVFVNQDILDQYDLALPDTKEEFLHCCQVLKENGVMPIAGNRWWMETFVLTQGFSSLYIEAGREEKIAAINSGETPISHYMRPGFDFLNELIEKEYFDVDYAKTAEAGDEKDMFLNGEVAFVVHYDTAINNASYGAADFNLAMIGFPTDEYGQVNLMNAAQRICINRETKHLDTAKKFAEKMTSREVVYNMLKNSGGFPVRTDIDYERAEILNIVGSNVDSGRVIPGSNPEIKLEQWGTTCVMVQELFSGKSVDEIMVEFDALQRKLIQ